jgi:hypothetical protein
MARQRRTPVADQPFAAELPSTELPSAEPPSAELQAAKPLLSAEVPVAMQAQHTPAQTLRHAGGMVRIGKGDQQRCIWPVHLSGWQLLGWQLVNQSEQQGCAQLDPEPATVSTTAEPVNWAFTEEINPAATPEPIEPIEAIEDGHPMSTTEGDTTDV